MKVSFPRYFKTCPICKRTFYYTKEHAFRVNNTLVCSWGCVRAWEHEKETKILKRHKRPLCDEP